MTDIRCMNRRDFLALTGTAAAGLVLGAALPACGPDGAPQPKGDAGHTGFSPDVFLQISPDGTVEVWVPRSEMGQGVRTGLPMMVAEELELPWEHVLVRQTDGAADGRYGSQLTGGSTSVRRFYDRLRRCGAVAREMLITAAAEHWDVPRGECAARRGEVVHEANGQRIGYGELVEKAMSLPVPNADRVPLKDPSTFRLIGTRIHRTDQNDFIRGSARYGLDTRLPGMLCAAFARCPFYGGKVRSFDDSEARRIPGVRQIVEFEAGKDPYFTPGVAVVADETWAAMQGVRALSVEWDEGPNRDATTGALQRRFRELAEKPGGVVRKDGNVSEVFFNAEKVVEAAYELPFLAHATMEPMNCTIRVSRDACEIWSPTQNPQEVQRAVADYLGMREKRVTVHVTLLGGGFGRRLYADTELLAARIARRVDAPVMVVWSREDDIRHDRYRPSSYHVLRGAVDSHGLPVAWHWHILNTYVRRFDPEDFPAYAIPNYRVEYTHVPWILPRGAWRATVNSQNPFVVQCFLDELAAVAESDPVETRLNLLRRSSRGAGGENPYNGRRMIRVLETAADRAGWGERLPSGVGRGVAFHAGYGSYVAEVAEVAVEDGRPRVRRVVCAVDCGQVINPDLVEAQCEGGIAFALSAALKQQITVEHGRVRESNFHDYPMLEIGAMPEIETYIIQNHESPGGMGEVPLPPLAPAVANAIYDATGIRARTLPLGTPRG
jgi:isoquinoline 1-oxidoreductase beta subunit